VWASALAGNAAPKKKTTRERSDDIECEPRVE
jgi:hypothetical protein